MQNSPSIIISGLVPPDDESIDATRRRFITFYDNHVLPNLALRDRLSSFFDKIFTTAENSDALDMMDLFITFETPSLAERARSIQKVHRNPRCEKLALAAICIAIATTCIILTVVLTKK